tara:strand:+ start:324 stop:587 length:264 start_codon:yes stop_codon:yes gene_type:complete
MENVNKEVQTTLRELYLDFNGNSTSIEKYLTKRIELFTKMGMVTARLFYEALEAAFFIQEAEDDAIREANKQDQRNAYRSGWDYGIR